MQYHSAPVLMIFYLLIYSWCLSGKDHNITLNALQGDLFVT